MINLPEFTDNLETKQDVDNYKEWLTNKPLNRLKLFKEMIEIERKSNPNRWKNIVVNMGLIEDEIKNRKQ